MSNPYRLDDTTQNKFAYECGYSQALKDISEKIKGLYNNYMCMPSINLFLDIV